MLSGLLQNVFVRLAIYVTSAVPGLLVAWGVSWVKISFDGVDWITLKFSVQGFATMVAGAVGLSGGIFAKFGKK